MPIEPTGSFNTLNPLNRQDTLGAPQTRASETALPQTVSPNQAPAAADVRVDTSLDQRQAALRSQVQEANDLGVAQQDRGEVLEQLRGERDRLAQLGDDGATETDTENALPADQSLISEDTFAALDRIRALALEDPFGTGSADAGPLADNGFFIRSRQDAVDTLDQAISALERQTDLDTGRLEELRAEFNNNQDAGLSEGNPPFGEGEDAGLAAAELAQSIREETPTDLFGLGEQDRETVLSALQP